MGPQVPLALAACIGDGLTGRLRGGANKKSWCDSTAVRAWDITPKVCRRHSQTMLAQADEPLGVASGRV